MRLIINQKINNKPKKILILLGIVAVTVGVVGGGTWYLMDQQAKDKKTDYDKQFLELQKQIADLQKANTTITTKAQTKTGVLISTGKTKYKKGEIINISVSNKLDQSILHYDSQGRFWSMEYFKDGKWANLDYKDSIYQVSEDEIGNTCSLRLYERGLAAELKSGFNLSDQWEQKICLISDTKSFDTSGIVRYMQSGQYRVTFRYGFEVSKDDSYTILDPKTVYSSSFTIE